MIHITTVIAERTRKEGTDEDFQKYALPHLSKARLEEIHQKIDRTLQDSEVQPINTSTKKLPSNLNPETLLRTQLEPENFTETLRALHSTLKSVMTLYCRTPGGCEQELKRHKDTAKFLWVIGRHGTLITDEGGPLLEITTEKIKEHLKYGKSRTKRSLHEVTQYKIDGSYIEDTVRIRFTEKPETAIVLQHYTRLLLKNNSERRAYSKFWKADMSVFSE